jgi:heterodisulfide reductase subunit B
VSIRKVLDFFSINFTENSKFSCCPEPNGIKNFNQKIYSITAARNLALAEQENKNILTPCNGCFETLKGIRSEIKVDSHFRNRINSYLSKINLQVYGKIDVLHLIEFFHKLGKDQIKDNLKYPLNGLRIAVHYGCHFLRPSSKIQMDDPMEPHIFDELIEDLGAESVDYVHKMDCCGGSLTRADNPDSSLEMIHTKLESMKLEKIDCIVVGCPQCFIQFDHLQPELKKLDYEYDIPVFYYSEILCIALGIDIREIIRKYHRVSVDKVFEKVDLIFKKNQEIKQYFNLEFLKKCYACGACNNDCPVAKISKNSSFNPQEIVGKILNGQIDEILSNTSIWMCLDCYICYELCPMRIGLVEVFTTLRNLAQQRGFSTKGFNSEFESFRQMGIVAMFSKAARGKVGLNAKKPELEDLKKLFNTIKEEG